MMFKVGNNLALPPDIATQTTAVLGIRGSGKTNTSVVITEELLKLNTQVIVIDPTDVWWGLKSSKNGKQAGFPIVVLGGAHGDLPLAADAGGVIADFTVEHRASVILSLRHLRKNAQQQFVTAFAEQLYHRKGEAGHRTPVLVVIDECDAFIPQRVGGAEARMVGAIEDLVRRGRAAGLGVLLISQRAASINKDVLTQIELLVAHRHTSPQDRKALEAWIEAHDTHGHHDKFMASLASLSRGQAWFWSPGWIDVFQSVAVRQRETFDSSSTPDAGAASVVPAKLAAVDLGLLQEKLKVSIADAKANDPKALKARITELERELAKAIAQPAKVERQEVPVVTPADREALEELIDRVEGFSLPLNGTLAYVGAAITKLAQAIYVSQKPAPSSASQTGNATAVNARKAQDAFEQYKRQVTKNSSTIGGEPLGKAERTILGAFYWLRAEEASPAKVSFYSNYSAKSSSFANALGKLRTLGLVSGWRITTEGCDFIGDVVGPKPSGEDLRTWLRSRLGRAENAMLDALIAQHPARLTNEEISEATGYSTTSSSFANALGTLRSLEAAEGYERDGGVRASDIFFA